MTGSSGAPASGSVPVSGSMSDWQLMIDGALDGAVNMAVDSGLLDEVEESDAPLTFLRFYQWKQPTLSLGKHQRIERAANVPFCDERGIAIVHRPTGGRAVLHDDELTYAIASNDTGHFGTGVYDNYRTISEALADGIRQIGVDVVLVPETRKVTPRADADLPCFSSPSRYELVSAGRKVVGSAQRRGRRGFLQHGSIPLTCDRDTLAQATFLPDPERLREDMAGLAEFLPERPAIPDLVASLIRAFQARFGVDFERRLDG